MHLAAFAASAPSPPFRSEPCAISLILLKTATMSAAIPFLIPSMVLSSEVSCPYQNRRSRLPQRRPGPVLVNNPTNGYEDAIEVCIQPGDRCFHLEMFQPRDIKGHGNDC